MELNRGNYRLWVCKANFLVVKDRLANVNATPLIEIVENIYEKDMAVNNNEKMCIVSITVNGVSKVENKVKDVIFIMTDIRGETSVNNIVRQGVHVTLFRA